MRAIYIFLVLSQGKKRVFENKMRNVISFHKLSDLQLFLMKIAKEDSNLA